MHTLVERYPSYDFKNCILNLRDRQVSTLRLNGSSLRLDNECLATQENAILVLVRVLCCLPSASIGKFEFRSVTTLTSVFVHQMEEMWQHRDKELRTKTPHLSEMCARIIRQRIEPVTKEKIQRLGLPRKLERYVCREDVADRICDIITEYHTIKANMKNK